MHRQYRVAIVGATGAVGIEMLHVMERRNFPATSVKLLASARSAGKTFKFRGRELAVETLGVNSFEDVDLAFFSAGSAISVEYAPIAVQSGAIVIDNSSAHRMQEEVPLIVPEINGKDIASHRGIIANPNCTTAITLMALYPLHRKFRVKRIFASSYQAVSGAGALAMEELKLQSKAVISGKAIEREVFPHQIAFNVIPQVDSFLDSGYTKEEMKLQNESRRIMHLPSFKASVTCVRVPVFRAHSVAVSAEFQERVTLVEAREAIVGFRGIELRDDPTDNVYPMPLDYAGEDVCAVGRLRIDSALENGLAFWVCGDQLLKGAALNAVQIAELL
ncbi:MAG TPA: aspartate-semialdehyde dehydrogenase [Terrimicrobiaceae bacterium]|nr:aspartate-semialdehyde dehydrogenase [Terrimicrobiaceae bacterium]